MNMSSSLKMFTNTWNINQNLNNLRFQQDDATLHNSRRESDYLSQIFAGRDISNNGDVHRIFEE